MLDPFVELDRGRARFSVRPTAPAPLEAVDGLLAGACEVDITPPPGMPKAGYSANAHTGTGFRTRLRARIVHLRAGTTSLALVQCDLLGGSAVLQHLVADRIRHTTDVPLAGLFIGATHTHAGPGQFLGTDFYNRFASNKSGFDPAWAAFLVDRIADGVEQAVLGRRLARVAIGSTEVWGLTRNRSLSSHVRNPEIDDKRTEPQRKYVAVNPLLHLLRVDAVTPGGDFEPLAAAIVFSVHGTGVSVHVDEYNADVWASICDETAVRVEAATGTRPIVGAMEGTHADVAPAIRPGLAGHLEASRVGRGIGAEAAALHARLASELRDDITLGCGLREVDLRHDRTIGGVTVPKRAAVGAALVAGAHENTTPVIHRIPPFRAGTPKPFGTRGAHGAKWVLGSRWGQPLVVPQRTFPKVLPIHVLRIGESLVVGLPFEVTVESGRRIERAVCDVAPGERVIVSSVANEYTGYVTTPEEYALQHYEGGHTIYGPNTQPFLAAHAARLAAEVMADGIVHDALAERSFDLKVHRYLPRADGRAVDRRFAGVATFSDPTKTVDGRWDIDWLDVSPGGLLWHEPLVRVEATDDGTTWTPAADDQWGAIQLRHIGPEGDAHRYRATWWAPSVRAGRQHRFVLLPNGPRPEVASTPFD